MNRTLLSITVLLTLLLITACGGNTPQTQPAPAATTEAISQPTTLPAVTDTTVPAMEAAVPTETEAAASTSISFVGNVMPILEAKCIKCHGVETKKEGLDLRTYETLIAGSRNGSVITAGDPANSVLVDLIQRGKMPNRGPKVTPEELQIIIDWINQGALNN